MKKVKNILLVGLLFISVLVLTTACGETKKEEEKEKEKLNYLVLVNKENKLPDNWEEILELETGKNSLGDECQVEKEA